MSKRETMTKLVEAVAMADRVLTGCGDNSCMVRRPKGMATNGGCRCPINRTQAAMLAQVYLCAQRLIREAKP